MSTAVTISRTDGRRPDQLRKLTVVYEGLDRVDGSARFGFGTQYLVSSVGKILKFTIVRPDPISNIRLRPD